MSLIRMPSTRRRIDPIRAHVYTVPVVRELPAPLVDGFGLGTW
jgi:hypothetical protein